MNTETIHTRGDIRDDGLIFWQYKKYKISSGEIRKYEVWLTPQKFKENKDRVKKSYKEYYAKNQARLAAKRAIPENRENKRKYAEEYRRKNKDLVRASKAKWARKPETKERKRQLSAKYRKTLEYKAKAVKYEKERKAKDPNFLLARRSRVRLRSALKRSNIEKSQRTQEYIGCSYAFLKRHIESQFKNGMAWEKPASFHIDHIRPLSSFDLTDSEQLKAAFHWSNLQPLYPMDNIKKGNKIFPVDQNQCLP